MNFTKFIKKYALIIYLSDIVLFIVSTVYSEVFGNIVLSPPILFYLVMFLLIGFIDFSINNIFINAVNEESVVKMNIKKFTICYLFSLSLIGVVFLNMLLINMSQTVFAIYFIILVDFFVEIFFISVKFSYIAGGKIKESFKFGMKTFPVSLVLFIPILFFIYICNMYSNLTIWITLIFILPTYIFAQFMIYNKYLSKSETNCEHY